MPEIDAEIGADPRWSNALLAARVLVAGAGLIGGVRLRAGAGPVRDSWLETVRAIFEAQGSGRPWLRIASSAASGRLTGGIDLAATLTSGRPVHEQGLLARADQGIILMGMAERLSGSSAAIIGRALDEGVTIGSSGRSQPSRFSVIALDESASEDEELPAALADRLTIDLDLEGLSIRDATCSRGQVNLLARSVPSRTDCVGKMSLIAVSDQLREAAAVISMGLPGSPLRRALDLLRVARLVAVLDGDTGLTADHLATAVRLCLGCELDAASQEEGTQAEAGQESARNAEEFSPPDPPEQGEQTTTEGSPDEMSEEDIAVAAAQASRAVLEQLARPDRSRAAKHSRSGKSGGMRSGSRRGRPAGIVSRPPMPGARPDVVSTMRAAIPWQRLRNPEFTFCTDDREPRLRILPEDLRYIRFRHRTESTTIFAVDASGSTAMERLAEAKGAVELLLGDCYVRRDQVALISFRGFSAETLLEPTRSLVRAKCSLTGLPGGGPTPFACAIRRSLEIAGMARRRGQSPLIVYLTDGSGNIDLSGRPNRAQASEDARMLAQQGASLGYRSILIDISRRPREATRELARTMHAQYCPLPVVSAGAVNAIVSAELANGMGQ